MVRGLVVLYLFSLPFLHQNKSVTGQSWRRSQEARVLDGVRGMDSVVGLFSSGGN